MKLDKNVLKIIECLTAHGYGAHVVGGCVRDYLLGKEPHDYDITTSATPENMREVFAGFRTFDTGIKHGTLTVLVDGVPYEVTTYRIDGEYTDNRHPDGVVFSDKLADDLSRRDFTINAMCYNPTLGFTDLFGGREDLDRGIIRTVGDARTRFREDALRILRALRFASVLGFDIEEKTREAIIELTPLLKNISRERILVEWRKLLAGRGAYSVLKEYSSVVEFIIPELKGLTLIDESTFNEAEWVYRELSLFAATVRENTAEAFGRAMNGIRSENRHKMFGTDVLTYLSRDSSHQKGIKHLLVETNPEIAHGVITLRNMLGLAGEGDFEILDSILKGGFCHKIQDMKIDGNDLITLGAKGKRIGEILNLLLLAIADGELENERTALLGRAKSLLN